jgi:multidrug efflux pump
MMYMSSQSTNDGAYRLSVTFKLGFDSDIAQVLVQNRVSLALPVIPALVQSEGINVKKVSPNTMMIVNLVSPTGRYDATFLSNYATIYIRDELARWPISATWASAITVSGLGSTPTSWPRLGSRPPTW